MSVVRGIISGDDVAIPIPLTKNDAVFAVDALATIKCSLISEDKSIVYIASTTQDSAAVGADWPNGILILEFTSAQTAAAQVIADTNYTKMVVEILTIDLSGKRQTFKEIIDFEKGTIA